MSGAIALHSIQPSRPRMGRDELSHLCSSLLRNRFLPVPPQDSIFVGDGDYRAIGVEFLRHFIELGDLLPEDRVLDIGCGIGRMAVPLTQYLDPGRGSYEGVDPVVSGIEWCSDTITPVYPNFRFRHLDIRNALYNPEGELRGEEIKLPFADGEFDFVFMTSVTTHLPPAEIAPYAREVARVLAPAGRLFVTAFVIDETALLDKTGRDARLDFQRAGQGPSWYVEGQHPLAAVAFDDGFIDHALDTAGLAVRTKSLGAWRGRAAAHYQDIIIAEKQGSGS